MDRLDEIISDFQDNKEEVHELLLELKLRRNSDIRSAAKFLSNSKFKQFRHIASEFFEVFIALIIYTISPNAYNLRVLIHELIDLQSSCQTMLEGPLGLSKLIIYSHRLRVVAKNDRRQYYLQS